MNGNIIDAGGAKGEFVNFNPATLTYTVLLKSGATGHWRGNRGRAATDIVGIHAHGALRCRSLFVPVLSGGARTGPPLPETNIVLLNCFLTDCGHPGQNRSPRKLSAQRSVFWSPAIQVEIGGTTTRRMASRCAQPVSRSGST